MSSDSNRRLPAAALAAALFLTLPIEALAGDAADLESVSKWATQYRNISSLQLELDELQQSPEGRIDAWTIVERQRWTFRWPDAMRKLTLQTVRVPALPLPYEDIPEWPQVAETSATRLEMVITADGRIISAGSDGFTVVSGPLSLSEEAPRWFRITPWLAAHYLNAIGLDRIAVERIGNRIRATLTVERLRLTFESTAPVGLRLVLVEEFDRTGSLKRADTFSDYRFVPELNADFPFRRSFRGQAVEDAGSTDPLRPEWRQGSVRCLSVSRLPESASSIFSFEIPASTPQSMVNVLPPRGGAVDGSRQPPPASLPQIPAPPRGRSVVIGVVIASLILAALAWYRATRRA